MFIWSRWKVEDGRLQEQVWTDGSRGRKPLLSSSEQRRYSMWPRGQVGGCQVQPILKMPQLKVHQVSVTPPMGNVEAIRGMKTRIITSFRLMESRGGKDYRRIQLCGEWTRVIWTFNTQRPHLLSKSCRTLQIKFM